MMENTEKLARIALSVWSVISSALMTLLIYFTVELLKREGVVI